MARVAALLLVLALVGAGCGGDGRERGRAELWVTRDRGERVLVEREVEAGQTVLDALREHADVDRAGLSRGNGHVARCDRTAWSDR